MQRFGRSVFVLRAKKQLTPWYQVPWLSPFLIEALKNGEASVVVPIANLSFAVAMLLSVFLGMEQLSSRKYIAIGFAALSVFLMAQTA